MPSQRPAPRQTTTTRFHSLSVHPWPAAGLAVVDGLVTEGSLREYHLLPSVRGDLLAGLGRAAEARAEFERAAGLTRNARERAMLLGRAAGCAQGPTSPAG